VSTTPGRFAGPAFVIQTCAEIVAPLRAEALVGPVVEAHVPGAAVLVVRAQVRVELALRVLEAYLLLLHLALGARAPQQQLELGVGGVALAALVDLRVVALLVRGVEGGLRRRGDDDEQQGGDDRNPAHRGRIVGVAVTV
jgi:hypothetical protein